MDPESAQKKSVALCLNCTKSVLFCCAQFFFVGMESAQNNMQKHKLAAEIAIFVTRRSFLCTLGHGAEDDEKRAQRFFRVPPRRDPNVHKNDSEITNNGFRNDIMKSNVFS
jgi:hypothetical protein